MPLSFAVVCEDAPDRDTACGLADRLFCEEVEWITDEVLDDYRQWRGLLPGTAYLRWRDVAGLAKQEGLKAHGHFDGEPGAPDAHAARRVLLLLKLKCAPLDGVLLIRDDDRETERRRGLEQGRGAVKWAVPVVIGLAHPKRECWVLAGFEPCSDDEQALLEKLVGELSFDPRPRAERLTSRESDDWKNAKVALTYLAGDRERQEQCWTKAPLTVLAARGGNTGLADYLGEIRTFLVPLLR